jgi:hypothetical protein
MRLPQTDESNPLSIDQKLFQEMVDIYMEKGFNYFDTSYAYHGGMSEVALRKALVERYPRESYIICDKMPTWTLTSEADNNIYVEKMLERLEIEYFDIFLIHSVNTPWLKLAEENNAFEYVRKMKEDGIAKKIGFSFHDSPELLEEILDKYGDMVDIVQLQINYLDWEDPIIQSRRCYEICVERGYDVYVMEPLKGGIIVNCPDEIKNDFKEFDSEKSIANLALRFVASLEHVKVVLSGISKMEDLLDNCNTYENFEPISEEEKEFLKKMAEKLDENVDIACSECGYCINTCPEMIPISKCFELYNLSKKRPKANIYKVHYDELTGGKDPSEKCSDCEKCLDHCTQKLDIPKELNKVSEYFKEGFYPYPFTY